MLIKKASFIGLRNRGSIRELQKLLPASLASKIVYQPCTTTLIRKIYGNMIPDKQRTDSVAFNVAFDREKMRYGENKEKILEEIAKAAAMIEKKGYKIYYALHCMSDDQFLPWLKKEKVHYEAVPLYKYDPFAVMEFYNKMDVVLGMRGHAQMIPFGLNCGIISLGSHDKMKWFLDDIDALDWYIELTDLSDSLSNRIVEKFEDIQEKNREYTRARLMEQQDLLWEITKDNWKTIQMLL